MVVGNFHIVSVTVLPSKADPPLAIDSDTELSGPITGKLLKPVARRDSQISQFFRSIENQKLTHCQMLDLRRQLSNSASLEDPLRGSITKSLRSSLWGSGDETKAPPPVRDSVANPDRLSLAGCTPAEPASVSPVLEKVTDFIDWVKG